MPEVITSRVRYPDSLEWGSPKTCAIKLYMDASDLSECQQRIDNMVKARLHLLRSVGVNE